MTIAGFYTRYIHSNYSYSAYPDAAGTETGYERNFESWRPCSHGRYCTTKEERVLIDCNPLDHTGRDSCL